MTAAPEIRSATDADLPAIKAIYDGYVARSIATFDLVAPALSYWQAKASSRESGDHLLVGEVDRLVVGYAYSSSYRPRPAYDRTRETSVYLRPEAVGRGLGRALYDDLLTRMRTDGVRTVVAVVALPNPASQALHRACGFSPVGVLPEVGHKLGRWVDTELWSRPLTH